VKRLDAYWQDNNPVSLLLTPFAWLFRALAALRRGAYRSGLLSVHHLPVPVVVVGNISVGGTGKTPLVAWLVEQLREAGFRPAIVSRGYGGRARHWPQQVRPDGDPQAVGDEPVLLARRCRCPVAVGPDRVAAAQALLEHTDCDLIVSDDGLQHYALGRDVEIAVIDANRRFGNGRCLPAGPLREPPSRLTSVDLVVSNGPGLRGELPMRLVGDTLHAVLEPARRRPLEELRGLRVHALAGIGDPPRFFALLRRSGIQLLEHPFPDHHAFRPEELRFDDGLPVLMTEKDAVKCAPFAAPNHWYLPVEAQPDPNLLPRLLRLLPQPGG